MPIKIECTQAIVRANSHRSRDKLDSLCQQYGFEQKEVWYNLSTDHAHIIPRALRERALSIKGIKEVKADYKKEWRGCLSFRTNPALGVAPATSTSPLPG